MTSASNLPRLRRRPTRCDARKVIGIDTTFLVELSVTSHASHRGAAALLDRLVQDQGIRLALVPQVIGEFLHVVIDTKRFSQPLKMIDAIATAEEWWTLAEVEHVFPTADASLFHPDWMSRHRLGRQRVLDTQLAAALYSAGVRELITSKPNDFKIFGVFELIVPRMPHFDGSSHRHPALSSRRRPAAPRGRVNPP